MKKALNTLIGFVMIIVGVVMILHSNDMFEVKVWALFMVIGAMRVVFADDKEVSDIEEK